MTEEIKAKRDELRSKFLEKEIEGKIYVINHYEYQKSIGFDAGFDQGFALAMEEANKLYKVMTTISWDHSDDCEDSEEDFSENETCECGVVAIRRVLKEFKVKVGE